jgi:hypothetical protein
MVRLTGSTAAGSRRIVSLDSAPEAAAEGQPVNYLCVNTPLFLGEGEFDYTCSACRQVVCEGIAAGDLAGVVVRCSCGAVNRIPAAPASEA